VSPPIRLFRERPNNTGVSTGAKNFGTRQAMSPAVGASLLSACSAPNLIPHREAVGRSSEIELAINDEFRFRLKLLRADVPAGSDVLFPRSPEAVSDSVDDAGFDQIVASSERIRSGFPVKMPIPATWPRNALCADVGFKFSIDSVKRAHDRVVHLPLSPFQKDFLSAQFATATKRSCRKPESRQR
jgi:hypothetical protein